MTAARAKGRWSAGLLAGLGLLTRPVQAGAAVLLLGLGVVTWLPATVAAAAALHGWRSGGDPGCFAGTFRRFPHYWRRLWPVGTAATAAAVVLAGNLIFLFGRPGVAAALWLAQLGLVAVAVVYLPAFAVTAGRDPDGTLSGWARRAAWFGFGSVGRGTALLGAAIAAPVLSVVVPAGPVLLGGTVPLLIGLVLAERADPLGPGAGRPQAGPGRYPEGSGRFPEGSGGAVRGALGEAVPPAST